MNYYRCFKWVQPLGCILLLLMCMHIAHAQNTSTNDRFKVTGRVTDQKGQLLPAVSVTEVNTNNGTTTDSSGTYTIYVSGKTAVLTFSIIGYKTRRAGVQQNGLLDMAMEENVTENEKV